MYFVQRQLRRGVPRGPSLFIAYLFWLCSGFLGLHRLYLRNNWGFVFIPLFLLILHTTDVIRDRREDVSRTRAAVGAAVSELDHAKIPPGVTRDAADAGAPGQGRGRDTQGQIGFRAGASRPDALAWLFALARDPDGGDADRRRHPAAGPCAQAENPRGRGAGECAARDRAAGRVANPAPTKTRRSDCTRDSPTRSIG